MAVRIQSMIGTEQFDNFNELEGKLKQALKELEILLSTQDKKQL